MSDNLTWPCPFCNAQGYIDRREIECRACDGDGEIPRGYFA